MTSMPTAFRKISWWRSLLCLLVLSMQATTAIAALNYIHRDGLLLYFPTDEGVTAERLAEGFPQMASFLETFGLVLRYPLHVVLDEDLDRPQVEVHMIPHREIRIPLRAPGALEEGYTESDPWSYFLFKGLCLQGFYGLRGGVPGQLHKVFGEIISPNVILPQWIEDGVSHLLFQLFRGQASPDPLDTAIYQASGLPTIETISNHPERWPGYFGYRIYGRPFIYWIYQRFGWEPLLDFLHRHGSGIIPIEIDLKAHASFGQSWSGLWQAFRNDENIPVRPEQGLPITGYWSQPFIYWDRAGVYPGIEKRRDRGRYGYFDAAGILHLSEYDDQGVSRLVEYHQNVPLIWDTEHLWDPGPGRVAVTRRGRRPCLIRLPAERPPVLRRYFVGELEQGDLIPAPDGVLQLSGPVCDAQGRIVVAANLDGNWDIWLHDRTWHRLTTTTAIEIDPWWHEGRILFTSNVSGRFQIHSVAGRQLTHEENAAMLPRGDKYLRLMQGGWAATDLTTAFEPPVLEPLETVSSPAAVPVEPPPDSRPYSPWPSIGPNYLIPDIYVGGSDFQLGIATQSRDVTGDYLLDTGLRYAFETDYLSARLGFELKSLGLRLTRYPLSYETKNAVAISQSRHEARPYWLPFEDEPFEVALNWRTFEPLEEDGPQEEEFWAATSYFKRHGNHKWWLNLDIFPDDSQSLFGGIEFLFGEQIHTAISLQAGKTWGDVVPGHNAYRIGGNVIEGYFTQRPTRLFPLRGFDSNLLEAGTAATTGLEIFWPLANLQKGHKTLPLFLHRLLLGTFVDVGFAGERPASKDMLVGAGLELVTSMEIAWGYLSAFRMGVAWPVRQPDYLDETGPVFLIQLGRPL